MLITFKTLQQKTFKIEIEETETIKSLKEKIAEERGNEFPIDGQKLIYAGKILDDEKQISEYKIDTVKNFVVVMAVKTKPKPAADKPKETSSGESSSSSTPAPVASTTETTAAESTATTSATSNTTATSETTATTTTTSTTLPVEEANNQLLTGSALEASIAELMSLGFSRQQVEQALQSSFNNADRAAEYLLSGNIPDINVAEAESGETQSGENQEPVAGDGGGSAAVGDLSFLRNRPQFQMMRRQLQQNPQLLPQLLQDIGQQNPQLLTLISQNQEAFIGLLNEPDEAGEEGTEGGVAGGGNVQAAPGGGIQIQVTPDEKAQIDKIVGMGFNEAEVIQAYFACEKNEALTVEFLLNQH